MAEQFIQLPSDAGNLGKKKRTRERVVGVNTVHEDYVLLGTDRTSQGKYLWSSTTLTVPIAAHLGTTTGFIWLYNPLASTVLIGVQKAMITNHFTALAVDLVAGEIACSRFTYTGVPTGATILVGKRDSLNAAPQGILATASTGMTVTLGAKLISQQLPTMGLATGGAGAWIPNRAELFSSLGDDQVILRAGEGLVFWSTTAVTTANRRAVISGAWEEYTQII